MSKIVLYIEDNDQNFYLIHFILNQKGYEVVRAHDGLEGINMAKVVKPDLILLDIQLPVMDGHTVAREIRKSAGLAFTPIVAVTSYAMTGDREKALESGCTGYIEKPINPQTFLDQIEKHLLDHNDQEEAI